MIDVRNLFSSGSRQQAPAVPAGQRVYAIGDIHGRLDLLTRLIAAIERDDAARGGADTTIILLGDLLDRGPDSAGVLSAARDLQRRLKLRIIAGNHEEMFLLCFREPELLGRFLRFGGRETLLSYGIDVLDAATPQELQARMRDAVPQADLDFIAGFEDRIAIGDYLFVHAGIRPGQPIERQQLRDLRWIREPFLSDNRDHGCVVVHGHTIFTDAEVRRNRIGIDTGAFTSGRLTALGLEGRTRWLLETEDAGGAITVAARPA
jgi:serine/threonine protein phosphatase 1